MPPRDDPEECKRFVDDICSRLGFFVSPGAQKARPKIELKVDERTEVAEKIAELSRHKGLAPKIIASAVYETLMGRPLASHPGEEFRRFKQMMDDGRVKYLDVLAKIYEGLWGYDPKEALALAQTHLPVSDPTPPLEIFDDVSPQSVADPSSPPNDPGISRMPPPLPPSLGNGPPPVPTYHRPYSQPVTNRGSMTEVRRLPVYLLLDCSDAMAGERIEAMENGVKWLAADLRGDQTARETVYLSVITFGGRARQTCPLTELNQFKAPDLNASGPRTMGAALQLLEQCLDGEIRKPSGASRGDWKPLVFLVMCGQPVDEWMAVAARIKQRKATNTIACVGDAACVGMLKHLTETVVAARDLSPEFFKQFLRWVSSSVQMTSHSVHQAPEGTPVGLPPLPPKVQII